MNDNPIDLDKLVAAAMRAVEIVMTDEEMTTPAQIEFLDRLGTQIALRAERLEDAAAAENITTQEEESTDSMRPRPGD